MEQIMYAAVFLGMFLILVSIYVIMYILSALWSVVDMGAFYGRQLFKRICKYIS